MRANSNNRAHDAQKIETFKKANQVWMDTDGDLDDLMSLTLIAACKQQVKTIGITPHGVGAAYLDGNLRWTVGMRDQLKLDYTVVAGKTTPVSYSNRYPYDAVVYAQENFGLSYKNPRKSDYLSNDELIETLKGIKGKIDLMIYGGATDWIEVIKKYPGIIHKVNYVYLYAGIINKDQDRRIGMIGNIKEAFNFKSPYDNDFAEWNVFIDSVAMKKVIDFFKSKVILFPINLSSNLNFSKDFINKLEKIDTPTARIWETIIKYLDKKDALEYIRIWSPVATLFQLLPFEKISKSVIIETHDVDVITEYQVQNDQNGKIILDSGNGNQTNVVMAFDEKVILDNILELIAAYK